MHLEWEECVIKRIGHGCVWGSSIEPPCAVVGHGPAMAAFI